MHAEPDIAPQASRRSRPRKLARAKTPQMSWATTETVEGTARAPLTVDNFVPDKSAARVTTHTISCSPKTTPLPFASQPTDLLSISFDTAPGYPTNLGDFLQAMDTDGFLVLHQGEVITELYPRGMDPGRKHALASITRNFVATMTAILVKNQKLDLNTAVETYMPELKTSGFAGATVQQLLDMRSGVTSSMATLSQAMFFEPDSSDPHPSPQGIYEYVLSLKKEVDHGGPFKYRAADTETLGCICETVTNKRMSQLISELIWQPMGAESEAQMFCDAKGSPMFSGGLCATLRDVARFGQIWLKGGVLNGQQLLPADFVHDTRHGNDDAKQAFSGNFFGLLDSPGRMYKNQVWNLDDTRGTTLMYGANGQIIYIDPPSELMCVVQSNWPGPFVPDRVQAWFNALSAIRNELVPSNAAVPAR